MREIRDDFKKLSREDATIRGLLSGSEKELRDQIGEIRSTVSENKTALVFVVADLGRIKTALNVK